ERRRLMPLSEIDRLIQLLSKLPGLGPRSRRRAALALMKRRESLLLPLIDALEGVADKVRACSICGNLDDADLWALERAQAFKGRYHVLGGVLSALDGVGPEQLNLGPLLRRVEAGEVKEVILALGATVDGQTTAHYLADRLQPFDLAVSRLAHG